MEAIPQEMARCRRLMLRPPRRRRCRHRCRRRRSNSLQRHWLTLLLPYAALMRLLHLTNSPSCFAGADESAEEGAWCCCARPSDGGAGEWSSGASPEVHLMRRFALQQSMARGMVPHFH